MDVQNFVFFREVVTTFLGGFLDIAFTDEHIDTVIGYRTLDCLLDY